jgi:hypothetical protein
MRSKARLTRSVLFAPRVDKFAARPTSTTTTTVRPTVFVVCAFHFFNIVIFRSWSYAPSRLLSSPNLYRKRRYWSKIKARKFGEIYVLVPVSRGWKHVCLSNIMTCYKFWHLCIGQKYHVIDLWPPTETRVVRTNETIAYDGPWPAWRLSKLWYAISCGPRVA